MDHSGLAHLYSLCMHRLAWALSGMCVLGLFHSIKLINAKEVKFLNLHGTFINPNFIFMYFYIECQQRKWC